MLSSRNPMKDKAAIAGAATAGYTASNTERTPASLAVDACAKVIRACGLTAADIDGICGCAVPTDVVQSALGIPEVTWFSNQLQPFAALVGDAASAVHSGLANTVLVYHAPYRTPYNTAKSLNDPFRRGHVAAGPGPGPESIWGGPGYTSWASRYMHEYDAKKESFGYVAINDRTNAARNPNAVMKKPLTMDYYLSARMIRWPLCLLDMDVPVDGGDAIIVTTAERARDLALPPVLIHAAAVGMVDKNVEDQTPGLLRHGQHVVAKALRARSDFWIDDIDIYFPYDGFTIITLSWFENMGFCKPGEAGAFLESNWDKENSRIMIGGRIPVSPHGGQLSEGASQGSGFVREAVHQLQGLAGERQVQGASTVLVNVGGFFFNSQGLALRKG